MTCKLYTVKRQVSVKDLQKTYQELNKSYVKVGIQKENFNKKISGSFTQGQNAMIQEFGNVQTVKKTRRFKSGGKWFAVKKGTILRTPARIFIRIFSAYTKDRQELRKLLAMKINQLMVKKDVQTFYKDIGVWSKLLMRDRINRGLSPSNAPMTIESKGFNKPLYKTGSLMNDIEEKVVIKRSRK